MKWTKLKDEQPSESGEYKVLHNMTSVNNGIGECYYDTDKGWIIPDMIASFYRIIAWSKKPE
jgi:hypothetical protein